MKNYPGMKLRPGINSDSERVKRLVFEVLTEYGLRPAPETTDADLKDIEGAYFERGGWFGVLEDVDGSIIGTCGIGRVTDGVCELRKMYVDPRHRGKGIGRMLLEDAIERARGLGFETMTLETASVLKEAIGLYVSFGFTEYEPENMCPRADQAYRLNLKRHGPEGGR